MKRGTRGNYLLDCALVITLRYLFISTPYCDARGEEWFELVRRVKETLSIVMNNDNSLDRAKSIGR